MIYRNLGPSGLKVSALSLGAWQTFGQTVDQPTTTACVKAAIEAGINYFDGAEAYGPGDEAMARALRELGAPRHTFVFASKVSLGLGFGGPWPTSKGNSRKHTIECVEARLKATGLDYLDLLYYHRPDPTVPLEEQAYTMQLLAQQGKILYWGGSEHSPEDILQLTAIARAHGWPKPIVEQTGYNMLGRERIDRVLPAAIDRTGIGTAVFCPLAGGLLTGKYLDGIPADSRGGKQADWVKKSMTPEVVAALKALRDLAGDLGASLANLALAWVLKNPRVTTAINGATKPAHVTENARALDVLEKLGEPEMARIESLLAPAAK